MSVGMYVCVCMYVRMYACMYVSLYVCMHVFIYESYVCMGMHVSMETQLSCTFHGAPLSLSLFHPSLSFNLSRSPSYLSPVFLRSQKLY